MTTLLIAMDRATVRRRDVNGYMHVEVSNISKANVCPYLGREIPGWQEHGLDPDRVYDLYRCPDELTKGAQTFNNVPLLSEHVPVIPEAGLPEDLIIGSTGTDASFDGTYLRNSLVVWSASFQEAIEAHRQKELSCGYRYRADMTAGVTPEGLRYDGVMREIMGNHVALVIEGRAGPDVVVGDDMMKLKSRTALMISGAAQVLIRPLLAADAKVDLASALKGVDGKTFAMDGAPKALATKIAELVKPHLAADAKFDADGLAVSLASIAALALDEDKIAEDEDEDEDEKQAEDEDPEAKEEAEDEDDDDKEKQAMDSATVRKLISDAEKRGARRVAAIDQAKVDVAPLVGEVVGMDSAEAIYRFALDSKGFDKSATDKAPLATLKAMVAREVTHATPMAQDRRSIPATGKLAAIVGPLPTMIRS